MFIRVVKRKLRYDVALDFKLLESYRPAPDQPPKHRFLKNWTIRQDDIWAMEVSRWRHRIRPVYPSA